MFRRIIGMALLISAGSSALAQENGDRYAQARLACLPDAIRLCPNALLDPEQARECMKDKKDLVSPECAAFYPGGKRAHEVH